MSLPSDKDDEVSLLKEILKWVRLAGMQQVKQVLDSLVDTDDKRAAYQLSDGTRGLVEVGSAIGSGKDKVAGMWKTWLTAGLGETVSVKGGARFKRSFSLEDFGIQVKLAAPTPQSQSETTESEPNITSSQERLDSKLNSSSAN